jgi:hypothetical protein
VAYHETLIKLNALLLMLFLLRDDDDAWVSLLRALRCYTTTDLPY